MVYDANCSLQKLAQLPPSGLQTIYRGALCSNRVSQKLKSLAIFIAILPISPNAQKLNDKLNDKLNFGVNYISVAQKVWILEFLTLTN